MGIFEVISDNHFWWLVCIRFQDQPISLPLSLLLSIIQIDSLADPTEKLPVNIYVQCTDLTDKKVSSKKCLVRF